MRRERRHALEAALASAMSAIVRRLPRPAVLALGRGLGRLWAALDRRHLRIAEANLRAAFPDWDEARLRATARGVYRHFGAVLLDLLWMEGRSAQELLALADVEGVEHMVRARAAGRGVVGPTGHFGNWEFQAVASVPLVGNVSAIARPLDNPHLDRRLVALRTATGNRVIYKQRALVQVLKAIRDGGIVAVLIDQNVQPEDGVFVDFFGRPAGTTPALGAFHLRTGAPLLPVFCCPAAAGRYRLRILPPIAFVPGEDVGADVLKITGICTKIIETAIREDPSSWLWVHDRWRSRPKDEHDHQTETP